MITICLMTKAWRSGSAWVAQMLAQAIAGEGAKLIFVAPLAEPIEREPRHDNVQRMRPPRELVGSYSKSRRVYASLSRIATSLLSVVRARATTRNFIFSIPEPLAFTLPLFALLRLSGARVIFIVHDAQPHAWSLPQRFRAIERGAHSVSYRLASKIVALTPTVKTTLAETFGIQQAKIHVIPHGPFALGDVGPVPGTGRFLIFGSLRRNKCVLTVIDGVKLARQTDPAVRLVLAGEPLKQEPGYWDACLASIAGDPDGFDVHEGFLPDEALPALIATTDCFVLAYENFDSQSGVGILAALAGRPVIGTASGGLGELFERGLSGQLISGDVTADSVAEALLAFREQSAETWDDKARKGASQIAETLRWDSIAREYIRLFAEPREAFKSDR